MAEFFEYCVSRVGPRVRLGSGWTRNTERVKLDYAAYSAETRKGELKIERRVVSYSEPVVVGIEEVK